MKIFKRNAQINGCWLPFIIHIFTPLCIYNMNYNVRAYYKTRKRKKDEKNKANKTTHIAYRDIPFIT